MFKIKSLLFLMMSSFQLFSMMMEIGKKDVSKSSLQERLFLIKQIQEHSGMLQELGKIIAYKSYALRMDEIYKKFDPFFHFNNDSYYKMRLDLKEKFVFFLSHRCRDDVEMTKIFDEIKLINPDLCRKFDAIGPSDLLDFTPEQDNDLLSLLKYPKPFCRDGTDFFSLQFNKENSEIFSKLPCSFKNKLFQKYPAFGSIK